MVWTFESKSGKEDWVSSCRYMEVAEVNGVGRGRKTWGEFVTDELLGLQSE